MAWKDLGFPLVLVLALIAANFLPPDTSLKQVRQGRVLSLCVPQNYPPLATPQANPPGIDIELAQQIAQRMGLRLSINVISTMGRDLNPRNWRVTRAQCKILAGGVVDSPLSRSFLDVTPPYLETGWTLVATPQLASIRGARVGVFLGVAGLDRVALGQFLREREAEAIVVNDVVELEQGLLSRRFDLAVTETLTARQIGGKHGWNVELLPPWLGRYPLVMGLWKGDLTLKREIVKAMQTIQREGQFLSILSRYQLASASPECTICR